MVQYWFADCEKGPWNFLGNLNDLTRSTKKDYCDWLLKLPQELHFSWRALSNCARDPQFIKVVVLSVWSCSFCQPPCKSLGLYLYEGRNSAET